MTQLPEPNFIERDAEKITREWIELYEQKTGKTLHPAQIERLLIDVGVYRENLVRIEIQETAKKNLLNYAPLEVLLHLGELVGVPILDAKPSKTVINFEITDPLDFDLIIPKNTQIETNDGKFIFSTLNDVILKQGETSTNIESECEIATAEANHYSIGTIANLITSIAYIEKASNIVESYGGADIESTEQYRERIRQAPESYSNAGSKGAYRFHTFSAHQSIIDVAVLSPSPGVVEIYPLTSEDAPDNKLIAQVQNYLSSDKIRPLTDLVIVKAPEKINFKIIANLILYIDADLLSVQTLVKERLNAYKNELKSKLGKDIVPSQIIAFLNSIYGVYKVELLSPEYRLLKSNQWANLEDIQINYSEGFYDEMSEWNANLFANSRVNETKGGAL